jgi:hypothetical protein
VLSIDNSTKSIVSKTAVLIDNIEGLVEPDSSVQEVVDYWVNRINATEVISYTSSNIFDGYPESQIGNLVTDGFLHHFDWNYNFGFTSRAGSFRDYFRQGDITIGDIISVMPFENNLLELNRTGAQILQLLEEYHGLYVYSGIRYRFYYNPDLVIHSVGIYENGGFYALNTTRTYTGLIDDFNWLQNHFGLLPAIDTGVHYRTAVVEYLRTLDDMALYSTDGRINETDNVWTYDPHPTTDGTTEAALPVELIAIGGGVTLAAIVLAIVVLRRR